MNETNESRRSSTTRSLASFTLRELMMLVAIFALVMLFFVARWSNSAATSNAPFSINSPIEYRFWHQHGNEGSGTGQIGSGTEWETAQGIEVYENFIILHLDDGVDRMVERDGLRWFDWRRTTNIGKSGSTMPAPNASGH